MAADIVTVAIELDFAPYFDDNVKKYTRQRSTADQPFFGYNIVGSETTLASVALGEPDQEHTLRPNADTSLTMWVCVNEQAPKVYLSQYRIFDVKRKNRSLQNVQDPGGLVWFEIREQSFPDKRQITLSVNLPKGTEDVFAAGWSVQTRAFANAFSPILSGLRFQIENANAQGTAEKLQTRGRIMYMRTAESIGTVVSTPISSEFEFQTVDNGQWWVLRSAKHGVLDVQTGLAVYAPSKNMTGQTGRVYATSTAYDDRTHKALRSNAPQWMVAAGPDGAVVLLVRQGSRGKVFAVESGSLPNCNEGFMKTWAGGVHAARTWLPCGPVLASILTTGSLEEVRCGGTTFAPPRTLAYAQVKTRFRLLLLPASASKRTCKQPIKWIWNGYNVQTCTHTKATCMLKHTPAGGVVCATKSLEDTTPRKPTQPAPLKDVVHQKHKAPAAVPAYGIVILTVLAAACVVITVFVAIQFKQCQRQKL
jgi:hypothetical protein